MTTYRVTAHHFIAGLVVSSDIVLQAAPVLQWTVGKQWEDVRSYCQQRGWTIEPIPDTYQPNWLEIDGHVYELKWSMGVLRRITLHEDGETKDLDFNDIPEPLKGLL